MLTRKNTQDKVLVPHGVVSAAVVSPEKAAAHHRKPKKKVVAPVLAEIDAAPLAAAVDIVPSSADMDPITPPPSVAVTATPKKDSKKKQVITETPVSGESDVVAAPKTPRPVDSDIPVEDDAQRSLLASALMIVVSEIGDKTFLVAAIMSMTHPRALVFAAAWSALALMSVLSALLGNVLPTLLSRTYTQALAALLFLVFGLRMVAEARAMDKDAGTMEEMAEVQAEIKALNRGSDFDRVERGANDDSAATLPDGEDDAIAEKAGAAASMFAALGRSTTAAAKWILSPIFVETFVLTFLAEWGDRSQIATIAMAAAGNVSSVIVGTVVGHSLCTGLAVVGGKMLATRISVRTVTMIGGVAFLLFAGLTFMYLE
ncbi:hypothetical protein BC828DRAFT_372199 [Blastocladiella britannica]|nr:hypothetical protein BC828DRAFT_372199 [Blastocladiella britannica]